MARKVTVERAGAEATPEPDVIVNVPHLGTIGSPPPRACNFCDEPAEEGYSFCKRCRREMSRLPHIA